MATRTVTVVTGTRAEYGLLRPAMDAIAAREDLSLRTIATGMHLSARYGHTVEEIEADGFTVDRRVDSLVDGDSGAAMAKSLGVGVSGMADALRSLDQDLVLVLGDRDEALAGGLAAAHMNVPLAHVHGGDSMAGAIVDDSIRHALTKFAHLHFPVSARSAERIERLGEEPWRITTVGAPGLDAIRDEEYTAPDDLSERHDIATDRPLVLAVQHPVTTAPELAGDHMNATLDALQTVIDEPPGEDAPQVVLIYPNSDAGSGRAIDAIESHPATDGSLTVESLPRADFLGVMAAADAMVGNSSSGIIEAPSFGLPIVDVGPRQEGRERGTNTVSVAHDVDEIADALRRCLSDDALRERAAEGENPYDYGGAGERIAERLAGVDLDERLLRKRLTY